MATGAMARPREMVREFLYQWEGRDKAGRVVRGEMRAGGESVVAASLRRRGILATKIKKQTLPRGRRISSKDLALFTRQLSTMLKAGVPLMQCFDIVGRGHSNPSMSRLLSDIRSDVETGTSLNQAFRRYPLHFDALFCFVISCFVLKGFHVEIRSKLAVDSGEQIQIEGGRHS